MSFNLPEASEDMLAHRRYLDYICFVLIGSAEFDVVFIQLSSFSSIVGKS
jgi:hypothetical protein